MRKLIRSTAKRYLASNLTITGWELWCRFLAREARRRFETASTKPAWLPSDLLPVLQAQYPLEITVKEYYDIKQIHSRSQRRVAQLQKISQTQQGQFQRFLDLGCWDGMVCYYLCKQGKSAIGLDVTSEGFVAEVFNNEVPLVEMDGQRTGLQDQSFDFIFSYDSFEHVPNPVAILNEAIRLLRPGGLLYLKFGPLYNSAKGSHQQFFSISVPYIQFLFPRQVIYDFAQSNRVELVDFELMNEWGVNQFRRLWKEASHQLECLYCYEIFNADYIELITKYPSCFRSDIDNFEELLVEHIEILFRKKIVL